MLLGVFWQSTQFEAQVWCGGKRGQDSVDLVMNMIEGGCDIFVEEFLGFLDVFDLFS